MNKNAKKVLLGANIVLLVVVCGIAMTTLKGRAAKVAVQKMTHVCTNIVGQVQAGTMDLKQAGEYATLKTSAGNYTPTVRILRDADDLLLETSDASFNVDALTVKSDDFYVVNCSQLVTS